MDSFEKWLKSQREASIKYLVANMQATGARPGVVVASPSKEYPEYYCDRTRMGAIAIHEIVKLYADEIDLKRKNLYFNLLMDYIVSTQVKQQTVIPNSPTADDRAIMLAVWEVDLSPRYKKKTEPPNDGPALRARALCDFALTLLSENKRELAEKLYHHDTAAHSVIKTDLDFISHHWRDPSYDPWGEVVDVHFSNLHERRRAMWLGAKLARKLGDDASSAWYEQQTLEIMAELLQYWKENEGFFEQTIGKGNLDSAVILSILDDDDDPFLRACDEKILTTIEKLRSSMHDLYTINRLEQSEEAILGEAIGRYPEDKGHPRFFTTAAFAEFSYHAAQDWCQIGQVNITKHNVEFLKSWTSNSGISYIVGDAIHRNDFRFKLIIHELLNTGDSFLRRFQHHAAHDGAASELIDGETGQTAGAPNFTWNFAAFLSAFRQRENLLHTLSIL